MQFLLSCSEKHFDVFSISLQDISIILTEYYRFAGRILSTRRDMFGKRTREVGKKDGGG
jgi:hypothetical protein